MQVSGLAVERLRHAAEALVLSPVAYVQTSVPTFETTTLYPHTGREVTVLHPLVAGPQDIVEPFKFHTFNISATACNRSISFRLAPPSDMKVSSPIVSPENPEMLNNLPKIGYAALRGQIFDFDGGDYRFNLCGEDEYANTTRVLEMPDEVSAQRLGLLIAGQVLAKATMAAVLQSYCPTSAARV